MREETSNSGDFDSDIGDGMSSCGDFDSEEFTLDVGDETSGGGDFDLDRGDGMSGCGDFDSEIGRSDTKSISIPVHTELVKEYWRKSLCYCYSVVLYTLVIEWNFSAAEHLKCYA